MAKKLTDEQIESVAVEALKNSLGRADSEIGRLRLRNIEAYNAQPVGVFAPPEVEDRSDFVATDVADTVNGMLPTLMQTFVASDDAVEFEGRGQPGSEQEAKLATVYVNHLFYARNDGVSVIHDWFWDALVQKVGFVKVWAEEEAEDSKQAYDGQSEEQLVMLLQDGWQLDEEPQVDETGGLSFTVRKESRSKAIRCAAVAPVEMRVDANARWDDDPAMIGHEFWKRRFEWEEEGYDLSDVGGNGSDRSDSEMLELLGPGGDVTGSSVHESHALIKGAEIYIKLDADGDGIAEWIKVCLVEEKLARLADGKPAWEQVDDHPFVWICPNPRPHSFYGDCPADFAYEPQRLRTQTVRTIQDNMFLTVNQRTYINMAAEVNIGDVLDSRAGGVIRGSGPASDALTPIVQPNLGAPAYQFNEYIASWNETRTGYNRYSAGSDANALNKTKGGMELLTAKADMRMGLTARHFAVGVRKLFAKMLKLAIKHQNQTEMVALNGQFVPINPGEFKSQLRTKINVGLGTGTKEQQSQRIMALAEMLGKMGQPAGVVQPKHVAELIRAFVEANEFKNPERFVDPEPTGMPATVEQFEQGKQQIMQMVEQLKGRLQQVEQENASLKAKDAAKQGDLALKSRQIEQADRKLDIETAKVQDEMAIRERDGREKLTQSGRALDRDQAQDTAVAELQQQVGELSQVVAQMLQLLAPQDPIQPQGIS